MCGELIGWSAMAMAVVGAMANNHRRRWCFGAWLVANVLSLWLHSAAALAGLAVHGWFLWRNES